MNRRQTYEQANKVFDKAMKLEQEFGEYFTGECSEQACIRFILFLAGSCDLSTSTVLLQGHGKMSSFIKAKKKWLFASRALQRDCSKISG